MKSLNDKSEKGRLHGMLSLEAALIFPVILTLLLVFVGAIHGEQDAMIISHALDQTSREIALLLPLADLLDNMAEPLSGIRELIPDRTLAGMVESGLSDIAATVLASPFILQRVDHWVRATAHSQGRRAPSGARRLAIDFDKDRRTIWLCLSFQQNGFLAGQIIEVKSRVPVWNAHPFSEGPEEDEQSKEGIWSLPNFERGQAFRRIFGGHLPHFYPVIAGWNGHEAVSIKSMDLTAPSWSSSAAAGRRVRQLVDQLASFEGAGGEGPLPGQIQSRRLILVIPDNEIAWKTSETLGQWRYQASLAGVSLDIREYGTSHAHQSPDWPAGAP
ncbi:MAG TPA: hypothetical protein PK646_06540 [Bacillota bacterium]|jgi:hypothetical protein|nr:hypothetical protein [Bacillota bacterium]HQB81725.1 hypothetical protein [Bacillota bacterium]